MASINTADPNALVSFLKNCLSTWFVLLFPGAFWRGLEGAGVLLPRARMLLFVSLLSVLVEVRSICERIFYFFAFDYRLLEVPLVLLVG